eukprot:64517-Pleurochrysis_carterae.AAC.2
MAAEANVETEARVHAERSFAAEAERPRPAQGGSYGGRGKSRWRGRGNCAPEPRAFDCRAGDGADTRLHGARTREGYVRRLPT